MIKVTFVCLGNICRSTMAEGVFQDLVDQAGLSDSFTIDSAGTSRYHIGEMAHRGTRRVLTDHGISYTGSARQITTNELSTTDYIIAMDRDNLADMQRLTNDAQVLARMSLLLNHAPQTGILDMPDPYYTNNFERVYQLVKDGCEGLLAKIQTEQNL
ncbi:low molecular weight protein-tyrosine-phosphatase [Anaerolineales bacterium HSG6]|nr:low molecular weight protein-tyrosine-phosphatase [Anaerolineales bacterium HSG6]MDM8531869.1 low molecular weight protein-tyrosine-phosphatase [Anaerolineales bacterium HSG25]